eukprot:CAMPEP_0171480374 /NCGR_PEP_ID=MMETSP0946-20130122/6026_1 /TAXON_ID=109269 /ORGANISM="Vaucheria litorea, Strain CCMP2940" /LENGTH=181 /DNA_ID=CAMNT_0012011571 /DNA_START=82 /DNA_END=624 /DNA_ORIENTATION=+
MRSNSSDPNIGNLRRSMRSGSVSRIDENSANNIGGNIGSSGIIAKKETTRMQIEKLEQARLDRRKKAEKVRLLRLKEEKRNIANGNPGDIDFQRLIKEFRHNKMGLEQPHIENTHKICVALRKRPVSAKEIQKKDHDSVSIFNPQVTVHNCKLKVDGITKYLDSTDFQFDLTFNESNTTEE